MDALDEILATPDAALRRPRPSGSVHTPRFHGGEQVSGPKSDWPALTANERKPASVEELKRLLHGGEDIPGGGRVGPKANVAAGASTVQAAPKGDALDEILAMDLGGKGGKPPAYYSGERMDAPAVEQPPEPPDVDLSEGRAERAKANGWSEQDQLLHDTMPDANPTPRDAARGFMGVAGAGLGGMAARALPGVGQLAGRGLVARAAGGAIEGAGAGAAQQAVTHEGGPQDLLTAMALGAFGSAAQRPSQGAAGYKPQGHEPRTQKEIDAATLARARAQGTFKDPAYQALPEGAHGTSQLATKAEEGIAARMEGRKATRGSDLGAAEEEVRQSMPHLMVSTDPEIQQIEIMRQKSRGPAGPMNPAADKRLGWTQRQMGLDAPVEEDTGGVPVDTGHDPTGEVDYNLTRVIPKERMSDMSPLVHAMGKTPEARRGPNEYEPPLDKTQRVRMDDLRSVDPDPNLGPHASFDDLRNLQKELNYRIKNRAPGDYGTAGDEQAAGIVAGAVRRADPREGPGNFAGALDRYGAGERADAHLNELLYNENGSIPPDRLTKAEAGRTRLAKAGDVDMQSPQGSMNNEARLKEIEQADPEARTLIDRIRQRNTVERRRLRPQLPYSASPIAIGKSVARMGSNLDFKLRPPAIDDAGMAYKRPPGEASQALPLELQLLLMQNRRQEGEP
jgi:hypothetical protein